jgi:hypothetical protein
LTARMLHTFAVSRVAFLPDGKTVLTCCRDRRLRRWEVATGKELGLFCPEHIEANSMSISRDGRLLFIGGGYGGCRLWEIFSGRPITEAVDADQYFIDVAFAPDAAVVLTASAAKKGAVPSAQLRETATLLPIGEPLRRQRCVAFHPSGKMFVTANGDGAVQLWDIVVHRSSMRPSGNESVESLWKALAGEDAARAFAAVNALAARPDEAVTYVANKLKPASVPEQARIQKLIQDLDDDLYDVREAAETELAAVGAVAEPAMRDALGKKPSLEVEMRLRRLLVPSSRTQVTSQRLQEIRSVQLLETIGSVEARAVLQSLTKGAASANLTTTAAAALARLDGRP